VSVLDLGNAAVGRLVSALAALAAPGHGRVARPWPHQTARSTSTPRRGPVLGQLDGTVGVVQREGHVASEHLVSGRERLFQPPQPGAEGAVEAGFLAESTFMMVSWFSRVRPRLAEHRGDESTSSGVTGLSTRDAAPPDGAAHHPTQDVARPSLAGSTPSATSIDMARPWSAITEGRRRHARRGRRRCENGRARLNDRRHQIGVEPSRVPAGQGGFSRARLRCRCSCSAARPRPIRAAVVLHEDKVPQLDEAVLATELRAAPSPYAAPLSMKISESGPQGP